MQNTVSMKDYRKRLEYLLLQSASSLHQIYTESKGLRA